MYYFNFVIFKTTKGKNVAIRNAEGKEFNAIINDRLAYKRAPRGQNVDDFYHRAWVINKN